MSNPTAAILIIGNEILSGRTQDANINFIAKRLSTIGISLCEARIIPDDEAKIISTAQELAQEYAYVFTTGGIGATHDDITAASIAKAFGRNLAYNDQIVKILKDYYQDRLNETRLRMALLPEGSELILNPVSAAPGFQIENVFCLAGIPSVMQAMFDGLLPKLRTGTPYYTQTVKSHALENDIAIDLAAIQNQFTTVEIGSYPSFLTAGKFGVSLVTRGTDPEAVNQATQAIYHMITSKGVAASIE